MFGPDWIAKNVERTKRKSSFLENNFQNDQEAARHLMRVTSLAEIIVNLQWVPGFPDCIMQMRTPEMIESTFAELEVGKLLRHYEVDFVFNRRTGKRPGDFDLFVTCPNGKQVCADTKCKIESTSASELSIRNSLRDGRGQIPKGKDGVLFVKVSRAWINDSNFSDAMMRIAENFTRNSTSIVSIKFWLTSTVVDESTVAEVVATREITNRRAGTGWNLFPQTVDFETPFVPESIWFRLR